MPSPNVLNATILLATLLLAGCTRKTDESIAVKSTLNDYIQSRPVCLFPAEKKFPAEADTNKQSDTAGYDALVDSGLLTRTTAEKSKLILLSKQVNHYDLSDKGRAAWTADTQQPGYGNFCYGRRTVQAITAGLPTAPPQPGTSAVVTYTYTIANVADWARAPEMQNAYPNLRAQLATANSATATLSRTNNGWQVLPTKPATAGDSGIVE